MTDKIDPTFFQTNNKPANQLKEKQLVSHQLLFDKKNIEQLEETLKTLDSLEDPIEEIKNEE